MSKAKRAESSNELEPPPPPPSRREEHDESEGRSERNHEEDPPTEQPSLPVSTTMDDTPKQGNHKKKGRRSEKVTSVSNPQQAHEPSSPIAPSHYSIRKPITPSQKQREAKTSYPFTPPRPLNDVFEPSTPSTTTSSTSTSPVSVRVRKLKHSYPVPTRQRTTMPAPEPGQHGVVTPSAVRKSTTKMIKKTTPKRQQAQNADQEQPAPALDSNDAARATLLARLATPRLDHASPYDLKHPVGRDRAVDQHVIQDITEPVPAASLPARREIIPQPSVASTEASAMMSPGAYAIDQPAPVYAMVDEEPDENEGEWVYYATSGTDVEDGEANVPREQENIIDAMVEPARDREDDNKGVKKVCFGIRPSMIAVMVSLLVVMAVVLGLVLREDGENSEPIPTLPPTTIPPTPEPDDSTICYSTSAQVRNRLLQRSRTLDVFVDLSLCNHTSIRTELVERYDPYAGNYPPLLVQSNMRVKCGENGSLLDECIVYDGQTLLFSSWYLEEEKAVRNVTFEGITFEGGTQSTMELMNAGDITFRNCLFRRTIESVPIVIQYDDRQKDPSIRQTVTFESCVFEDMTFSEALANSEASHQNTAALVTVSNPHNTAIFKDCVFRRNTAKKSPAGLITAYDGAQVHVENSCFYENTLSGQGSPVLLIGNNTETAFSGHDNYANNADGCSLVGEFDKDKGVTCGASMMDETTTCESSWHDHTFDFKIIY